VLVLHAIRVLADGVAEEKNHLPVGFERSSLAVAENVKSGDGRLAVGSCSFDDRDDFDLPIAVANHLLDLYRGAGNVSESLENAFFTTSP
jgi:hypothetical protein